MLIIYLFNLSFESLPCLSPRAQTWRNSKQNQWVLALWEFTFYTEQCLESPSQAADSETEVCAQKMCLAEGLGTKGTAGNRIRWREKLKCRAATTAKLSLFHRKFGPGMIFEARDLILEPLLWSCPLGKSVTLPVATFFKWGQCLEKDWCVSSPNQTFSSWGNESLGGCISSGSQHPIWGQREN